MRTEEGGGLERVGFLLRGGVHRMVPHHHPDHVICDGPECMGFRRGRKKLGSVTQQDQPVHCCSNSTRHLYPIFSEGKIRCINR